jgi:gallate decarboxylase subunit C
LPSLVKNVDAHSSGGGKFLAVLQVQKQNDGDGGMTNQAAIIMDG